jgi:pimeloyl-ACP methyl ester carboxylesterase
MSKSDATIVLVHGAWADGSSWNRVIPLLQAKDMAVIAVQLPLTSLVDDLVATNRIIADTKGDIVLVGHSWGGMAITQAGNDPRVLALVYVSAFAPDVGETGSSLIGASDPAGALDGGRRQRWICVSDNRRSAAERRTGSTRGGSPDHGRDSGTARGNSI